MINTKYAVHSDKDLLVPRLVKHDDQSPKTNNKSAAE